MFRVGLEAIRQEGNIQYYPMRSLGLRVVDVGACMIRAMWDQETMEDQMKTATVLVWAQEFQCRAGPVFFRIRLNVYCTKAASYMGDKQSGFQGPPKDSV